MGKHIIISGTEYMLAVNLIDEYRHRNEYDGIKKQFSRYKTENIGYGFSDLNPEFGLKTGDVISFVTGYHSNIYYTSEILGFDAEGQAYILWDCYWYSIKLWERLISMNIYGHR